MILIDFYPNGFICKGHANSAPYNHDLVCAGVSAIVIGALNWFDKKANEIVITNNEIKVICNDTKSQSLLDLLLIQLKSLIYGDYKKYINLTEHDNKLI